MEIEAHSKTDAVIVMTRLLDAPREVCWRALTDAKHVAHWFGGHGFSNPVCEMDVRPGGRWKHVMRTPDGSEFAMEYVFVEVVKPEKLSWKDAGPRKPGMHASPLVTVTLEDEGEKTRWKMVARFDSIADREQAMGMGFTHVLTQGTEKFNEIVRTLASS